MTDVFDRCPKCGALVRRGSACLRCAQQQAAAPSAGAAPQRRVPSATLTVVLLAIIPFLVMVAVLFHVAMYAVSAPATIALDVIIVAAIAYDIRQVVRSRAR